MAVGQTGEGKTAEMQAFSYENTQNTNIFPSSAPVCELGHLPPGEGLNIPINSNLNLHTPRRTFRLSCGGLFLICRG